MEVRTIIAHRAAVTLPYALERDQEPELLSVSPVCYIFLKRYKDKEEIIMDPSKYCLLIEEHANGDKECYAIYIQPKYI